VLVNVLFAALLLFAAALLARHSERGWRAVRDRDIDQHERNYYVRRRRRRLGISAIIALIALAIPLSSGIGTVLIAEVYLFGLVGAVLLMLVISVLDLIAAQLFATREKTRLAQTRVELEVELKRARERLQEDNQRAD